MKNCFYVCCYSVTKSCLVVWYPMACSTLGFSVLHYLPEFAQTHVHQVGDANQPSCPLSPTSPLALNLSQHQGLSNESALHIRWPKYWSFIFSISLSNEYSELISIRIDGFDVPVQRTFKNLLQHHNLKAAMILKGSCSLKEKLWQTYTEY